MKLVIAALNAKYVHTSLSARCLYLSVKDSCDCEIAEYTINDSLDSIIADLYSKNADVIAFSCYIWNIEQILKITEVLKLASNSVKIILGGYEAEYDAKNIMQNNPQIDFISIGEGEIVFSGLIRALCDGLSLSSVCGLAYRHNGEIKFTEPQSEFFNLDDAKFVCNEKTDEIKDKIIYYESSRGCPYGCTYCLSGDSARVRFKSVEKVKKDLDFFIKHGVKLVKFVDRTFNANPKRAYEIFKYIIENSKNTCFHMELAGDILDERTVLLLKNAPKGILQFEIGVQTTNSDTMKAIERKISFEKLKTNVEKIMEGQNIHIHLDLIAGLPYEDLNSFKKSFNDVIGIRPDVLQLGFLKLLKGSKIRKNQDEHKYVYRPYPPYEVISNAYISYKDLIELKTAENALDKFYNSGSFSKTVDFLFDVFSDRYSIMLKLGEYMKENCESSLSKQTLFEVVHMCFGYLGKEFDEALKYDFLKTFRAAKRPQWFGIYDEGLITASYEMFKDEKLKEKYFPKYFDVPAKEIMKNIHTERFSFGVLMFDYKDGSVTDITGFIDNVKIADRI